MERRFDIDWLRVIAIGLLLIYHISIAFQPWGVFIGFIQNDDSMEWIWTPMSMLNIWRIPLLFFVSGMGIYFAMQRRDWKQLLLERSKRILVPFLFGVVTIVPLQILIWQHNYHQDIHYVANPAHLWFLGNIFSYVLLVFPLFIYLKNRPDGKFQRALSKLLKYPAGLLLITLPFILEAELIQPKNFELYAMTMHGFWLGLIAFSTGFLCVFAGESFWQTVTKWKWGLLGMAFSVYIVRVMIFNLRTPDFAMAIESNLWTFTILGFGHAYLNRPSKALSYLSQAAYPVYLIHILFLFIGSWLFFGLSLPPLVKFLLLNLFTLGACLLVYEGVIRRVKWLRPWFGLKGL